MKQEERFYFAQQKYVKPVKSLSNVGSFCDASEVDS